MCDYSTREFTEYVVRCDVIVGNRRFSTETVLLTTERNSRQPFLPNDEQFSVVYPENICGIPNFEGKKVAKRVYFRRDITRQEKKDTEHLNVSYAIDMKEELLEIDVERKTVRQNQSAIIGYGI